jgi:hypothetical protein
VFLAGDGHVRASKQAPLEKLHFQILDSRVLQLAADFSLVKDLRSFILFV